MQIKPDYRFPSQESKPLTPAQQKTARNNIESSRAFTLTSRHAEPLNNLIYGSSLCLYTFFHDNGYMIARTNWNNGSIHKVLAGYIGWVYAFYDMEDVPLYIGETSRTFGERFNEHMNKKQDWWPHWTRVKVLPCPNQTVRKVFESLIGLAGGYEGNKSQPAGVDDLLKDVLLSLLSLGNEKDALPIFNNESIAAQANLVLASLPEQNGC